VGQGCAPEEVPNCEKWKISGTSSPDIQILQPNSGSDKDGWKIVCSNCLAGSQAFSTTSTTGFTYTTYQSTEVKGIGCPLDNTYHFSSCTTMKYSADEKYECICSSSDISRNRVTFTTYDIQTITQGCVNDN
jgi:hypothetical protein